MVTKLQMGSISSEFSSRTQKLYFVKASEDYGTLSRPAVGFILPRARISETICTVRFFFKYQCSAYKYIVLRHMLMVITQREA